MEQNVDVAVPHIMEENVAVVRSPERGFEGIVGQIVEVADSGPSLSTSCRGGGVKQRRNVDFAV